MEAIYSRVYSTNILSSQNEMLDKLRPTLRHVDDKTKKELIASRFCPKRLLYSLVADPTELLNQMKQHRVVLGGSRAIEYFVPGSCTKNSDWDFYISDRSTSAQDHDKLHSNGFVKYLKSIGAQETESSNPASLLYNIEISYPDSLRRIVQQSLFRLRNNIISVIIHENYSNIDIVSSHDFSISQCMITGYCAISMQHELTKQGKSIIFNKSDIESHEAKLDSTIRLYKEDGIPARENGYVKYVKQHYKRVLKYQQRGIVFVDSSDSDHDFELRMLTDKNTHIVFFDGFPSDNSYDEVKWVDVTKREVDSYMNMLEPKTNARCLF